MDKWFGTEGYLQSVFGKIRNLAILNICFLASCLPVVTIGAAVTALCSVNLRMIRDEEGRVSQDYWKALRDNFRQGTRLWLVFLAVGVLFAVDFWALGQLDGMVSLVLKILLGALLLVCLALLHYVFAYAARFADPTGVCLKNALILCGANLLHTFSMLSITFLALFVSLYSLDIFLRAVYIWLVLGFAAVNYAHCFLLRRIFARYENGEIIV